MLHAERTDGGGIAIPFRAAMAAAPPVTNGDEHKCGAASHGSHGAPFEPHAHLREGGGRGRRRERTLDGGRR